MVMIDIDPIAIPIIPTGTPGAVGPSGDFKIFDSRAAAGAASIPLTVNGILANGYNAAGSAPTRFYKRVGVVPSSHLLYFQDQLQIIAGTGWWELTSEDVDIMDAGAAGNGSTDDTAPFERACNYLNANKGSTLRISKPHAIATGKSITRQAPRIIFLGAGELVSIGTGAKFGILTIGPSPAQLITTISQATSRHNRDIYLTSVAGLAVGMLIRITWVKTYLAANTSMSHVAKIYDITGNRVRLSHGLPWDTELGKTTTVYYTAAQVKNPSVYDLKASGEGHSGVNANSAIHFQYCENPRLYGSKTNGFRSSALIFQGVLGGSAIGMDSVNDGITQAPIGVFGSTDFNLSDFHIRESIYFGLQLDGMHYGNINNFEVSRINGRAVKLEDTTDTSFVNFGLYDNMGMGLGITGYSSYNNFVNGNIFGTVTNPIDGTLGQGIWSNDYFCIDNSFVNVKALGSSSMDWAHGGNDTGCSAINCRADSFTITVDSVVVPLVGTHSFKWISGITGYARLGRLTNQTIARVASGVLYRKVELNSHYTADQGNCWSMTTWEFTTPDRGQLEIIANLRVDIPTGGGGSYLALFKAEVEQKAIGLPASLVPAAPYSAPVMVENFDVNAGEKYSVRLSHAHASADAIIYAGSGTSVTFKFT